MLLEKIIIKIIAIKLAKNDFELQTMLELALNLASNTIFQSKKCNIKHTPDQVSSTE
jgi:hypothetical protein